MIGNAPEGADVGKKCIRFSSKVLVLDARPEGFQASLHKRLSVGAEESERPEEELRMRMPTTLACKPS